MAEELNPNPAAGEAASGQGGAAATNGNGAADASEAAQSAEGSIGARLAEAEAKAAEYYDAFVRSRAEMENVRRRAQDEVSKAHKFAVESFAQELLPVVDSLEAALKAEGGTTEAMRAGVELTLKQLLHAFEKNKLMPIDPAGQKFDPNLHQAISMVPSAEVPAQHVVATLQKGWTIAERVLRPALVTVSQGG